MILPELVLAIAFAASVQEVERDGGGGISLPLQNGERFEGVAHGPTASPFAVLAGDFDLDGDPDLLFNWHNLGPLELFENDGGRLRLLNAPGGDETGLFENPGVPYLYGDEEEMLEQIRRLEPEGITIWHDLSRQGFWNAVVVQPEEGRRYLGLRIGSNKPISEVRGLDGVGAVREGERDLAVPLGGIGRTLHFQFRATHVSTRIRLRAETADGEAPDFHIGPELTHVRRNPVELWKPDPHGIAWVQVHGSPEPEVFITRGGLKGGLVPPDDPKRDRFYVHTGGGSPLYWLDAATVPAVGYGRGRQVEWVDVDNDGRNELYVGNKESENVLWRLDPETGRYVDGAAELGLALRAGDSFAWVDLDEDGFQDLIHLGEGGLRYAMNGRGTSFADRPGEGLGLRLPDFGEPFEHQELLLVDWDDDGSLDLLASGLGPADASFLFSRTAAGFEDVTKDVGLDDLEGTRQLLLADFDDDAYEDVLSLGISPTLLRNVDGLLFEGVPLPRKWAVFAPQVGTICDLDADGRLDVVCAWRRRCVSINATENANGHLDVHLDCRESPPFGTLVTAYYADGRVKTHRFGSWSNARYSQTQGPLHFGIPEGSTIERIGIRWPGSKAEQVHPVAEGEDTLHIRR